MQEAKTIDKFSSFNIGVKIFNKILANRLFKKLYTMAKWNLLQGCKTGSIVKKSMYSIL